MPFERSLLPEPTTYFENQGLILKGPRSAKWKTTTCNFHGGSDSLRVNVASGAWVCMSCGEKGGDVLAYEMKDGGKEFVDAAKALGCWIDDGRPPVATKPTPLSPRLALSVMAFESTLAAVAAGIRNALGALRVNLHILGLSRQCNSKLACVVFSNRYQRGIWTMKARDIRGPCQWRQVFLLASALSRANSAF